MNEKKKRIRNQGRKLYRNDCILAVAVCATALVLWAVVFLLFAHTNDAWVVTVSIDGETAAELSPYTDGLYEYLDGAFVLEIKNEKAYVVQSNCPDGECERMHVDFSGGRIVCLPNRIVITAKSVQKEQNIDFRLG